MERLAQWQVVMFVIMWLSYGSSYLIRKPLGIIKADVEKDLHATSQHLGWMDAAFLLPYALVSLMLGCIGDRLGPRVTLGGGLVVASVATALMSKCESFKGLLLLLGVSGASQALCWPACCAMLSHWYPDTIRNTVFGVFGSCCFVFGMAGTAMAVYLEDLYGWRTVFVSPAFVVAVMGFVVIAVAREPEERGLMVPGCSAPVGQKQKGSMSMRSVLKISPVPEVSVTMFCVKSVRYALMFWLPLYLLRFLKYSQVTSGLVSTAFEVGGIVGSALVGVVVDRCMHGQAILTSAVWIMCSALSLMAFMLVPHSIVLHVLFLALAGAFNCGPDVLLAGSVAADLGERVGGAAAVTGVVNGFGSLGTVLEGPLVGILASSLGWGSMIPLMGILSVFGAIIALKANVIYTREKQGRVKVAPCEVA